MTTLEDYVSITTDSNGLSVASDEATIKQEHPSLYAESNLPVVLTEET